MKSLTQAAAVAVIVSLLAAPVASFAQSNTANAAGATAQDTTQQHADANNTGGYGGVTGSTAQSGAYDHPQYDVGLKSIYIGH
jgi:hypothetical protein